MTKPNMDAIQLAVANQLDEIEDALFQLIAERVDANTVVGVQLDNLGALVGAYRNTLNDTLFRNSIRATIVMNTSHGTIEDVIGVVNEFFSGAKTIEVIEYTPATVHVIVDDVITTEQGVRAAELFRNSKPSSVNGVFGFITDSDYFAFFGDPSGSGFDDGTGTVGGAFAGALG